MKKTGLALALAATVSTSAMANDMYWGVGMNSASIEISTSVSGVDLSVDDGTMLGNVIIGKNITKNFAIEGVLGMSLSDATYDASSLGYGDIDLSVDNFVAVYGVGKTDLNSEIDLYAKFGYLSGSMKGTLGGESGTDSDQDFSYGVGMDYKLNKDSAIGVEYVSYIDKDYSFLGQTFNLSVAGFGINYKMNF